MKEIQIECPDCHGTELYVGICGKRRCSRCMYNS